MSEQEQTADASREAYYDWWVENSPTDHSHHVVHGTKGSIEALKAVEAERDTLREKLSSTTEDYIKERNAATAAEAERDVLRATLTEETQKRLRAESEDQQQRTYARNCGEQLATLRAEVERRKADAALIVQKIQRALDGEKP